MFQFSVIASEQRVQFLKEMMQRNTHGTDNRPNTGMPEAKLILSGSGNKDNTYLFLAGQPY